MLLLATVQLLQMEAVDVMVIVVKEAHTKKREAGRVNTVTFSSLMALLFSGFGKFSTRQPGPQDIHICFILR